MAVLKLALSPLYFLYRTEFASDDANQLPFFQQGPLRLYAFHSSLRKQKYTIQYNEEKISWQVCVTTSRARPI